MDNYKFILELLKMVLFLSLFAFNGLVLFRAAAKRIFRAEGLLDEEKLFTHGFFLSFIINGIIGQYLAIFHIFHYLTLIFVFALSVIVFRREAFEVIRFISALPSGFIGLISQGKILEFLSWALFLLLSFLFLLRVQVPSLNADVWVHHIPIAESFLANNGFVYPVIPHPFYGNMPSFVELLFAEGLAFVSNYSIANLIHFAIFWSFLLFLASCSRKGKALALVLLSWILIDNFFSDSVTAMTDVARSVFDAASIIFLLLYLKERSSYYLIGSALLLGSGLASKYLGLLALFFCGLILVSEFRLTASFLRKAALYSLGILIVCGFWYGKSAVSYGNPIYPYFFGHPGISDQWMADLKEDQGKAFQPEYRSFSRNIRSTEGWKDFPKATYMMFFNPANLPFIAACIAAALVLVRGPLMMLAPISVAYLALWYFFVFHHARYGLAGYLLFVTAFYFSAVSLAERFLDSGMFKRFRTFFAGRRISPEPFFMLFIMVAAIYFLDGRRSLSLFYKNNMTLLKSYASRESFEEYVSGVFPYYRIYGTISEKNLKNVLNPLDSGVHLAKYIISGGVPEDTFLPWNRLCESVDELDSFLKENGVEYYVKLKGLPPVALERLGDGHAELAFKVFEKLGPSSELMYSDESGDLYRIRKD